MRSRTTRKRLDAGALALGALVLARPAGAQCDADALFAAGGAADERFGAALALDPAFPGAGRALVGAPLRHQGGAGGAGAAFLLERVGGDWVEVAEFAAAAPAADAWLGSAVAVHGATALVGARGDDAPLHDCGAVLVFEEGPGGWSETAKLTAADAAIASYFGSAVAMDLDSALIGAPHKSFGGTAVGAVYAFERGPGGWRQVARLVPSDYRSWGFYGGALALDGATALVGSIEGARNRVHVLERAAGAWSETAILVAGDADPEDGFGAAVALDGDRALVGAPYDDEHGTDAGAAYVFERGSGDWAQTAKLTAGPGTGWANLGQAVALAGDRAVVGEDSRAWVFERGAAGWEVAGLLWPETGGVLSEYGSVLALRGSTLVVGQPRGPGVTPTAGAAHAYRFADGVHGYCSSTVNSSGGAARISGLGCGSFGANDLVLEAVPLPLATTGFFFYGPERVGQPFGVGVLCVGGGVTRLEPTVAVGQTLRQALDLATLGGGVGPGSTLYFQAWFRDPPLGGANLSDGLAVTVGP